ncbi:kinase-like domain-containing protein [Xylaria curta]|nr:kinase-like domain-containing protein [Xylaria curta]
MEHSDTLHEEHEVPHYAQVEGIGNYVIGGFHPIHIGDRIGPDEQFEVHHKLGYSNACAVWLCFDRRNERRVGIKVFQPEKSTESHPEIVALRLFEGIDREELRSNRIVIVDEHFWINGPNGRHLCFAVQVLGPAISYMLSLDTPDLLTDLCFQAAQSLKYLHDKKICHGDFRADHMRFQLDLDAMSYVGIYDLFGKPKVWRLDNLKGEGSRRPDYLVEPVDIIGLDEYFRTGEIAIDSFTSSYRDGDAVKPQIIDSHYTPPEIRFLKKPSGPSSDIWSLAATFHLVRTARLLLDPLDSKSSIVSWLAWAYGPFPKDYWQAIMIYLSDDSAVPVFSVNTIPQQSQGSSNRGIDIDSNGYPRESRQHREGVVALCLGEEETPRSIRDREMLQYEKDRSKYLRIKLPKDSDVWMKFQEQRKRLTGFPSLLYEDLSKERQWYGDTDALNGKTEDRPEILPSGIDDAIIQQLSIVEDPFQNRETDADVVNKDTAEDPKPKKPKTFVAEYNLRDQVERVEQYDGVTKVSYRLQPEEVGLLASLLRDMLRNDPNERISIDEVLQHEWFEASRKRFESI